MEYIEAKQIVLDSIRKVIHRRWKFLKMKIF